MADVQAAFIHSALDDAGLSASEFRVFCHVARRGECFSSVETISRICRLDDQTVRDVLKRLVEKKFLIREMRSGTSNLYRVAPIAAWHPSRELPLPIHGSPTVKPQTSPPKRREAHPSQTAGDKGNPSEVYPQRGTFPHLEKFADWQLRKDLRETSNPVEAKAIKAELSRRKGAKSPKQKIFCSNSNAFSGERFQPSPELAAKFRKDCMEAEKEFSK